MSAITIAYQLNPPTEAEAGGLNSSKDSAFPVNANPSEGQKKYYNSLQKAIVEAKNDIGNDLTAWKEAVGKAELSKETPKTLKYEDTGEEEEEEEEVEEQ